MLFVPPVRLPSRLPPSPKIDKIRSTGMSVGSALSSLTGSPKPAPEPAELEGGYVGSMDNMPKVHRRMSRRSELAVIGDADSNMPGFMECHFKVRGGIVVFSFPTP